MNYSQKFKKIPNNIAILAIKVYRGLLSPSVGLLRFLPLYPTNTCIFHPTCSQYAIMAYTKYGFFDATHKTIGRIGRCHPRNTPSVDYP